MASADSFDRIVTFGASLTDDHNLYDMSADVLWYGIPLDMLGYNRAATDGAVYTRYLADQLGIENVDTYAVAGSRAAGEFSLMRVIVEQGAGRLMKVQANDSRLSVDVNLGGQVERFLSDAEGQDMSGAMAVVQIGYNDYFNMSPRLVGAGQFVWNWLANQITSQVLDAAKTLSASGVGQVVVNTLAPVDAFAFAQNGGLDAKSIDGLNSLMALHNEKLAAGVADMADEGVNIVLVDMGALMGEIADDPTAFGFIAPLGTHSVVATPGEQSVVIDLSEYDTDQVAFFDQGHPTTVYHAIMGAFEAASLTGDTAILGDANDIFAGSDANDLILASGGNDQVTAAGGDDIVLGGLGNDVLDGGAGRDLLSGGSGADTLTGGSDADVLAGGAGDDWLRGGDGQDVLIGGLGADRMEGGAGDDVFLFTQSTLIGGDGSTEGDIISGGAGYDILFMALDDATRATITGDTTLEDVAAGLGLTFDGIEEIVLVDDRLDLALIETEARLGEADLWGMI